MHSLSDDPHATAPILAAPSAAAQLAEPSAGALVLVDYQQRLLPAIAGGARVLAHAVRLAEIAQLLGLPVLGTEQNPGRLGPNDPSLRERCRLTLPKLHFDACADGLVAALRAQPEFAASARPLREVVIAGCEAHVCLLQTTLGLLRAGLAVRVVAPACGSRAAADHALAMQRLAQAGAVIASVEMVAFEWLRSCEHPRFRAVLALLKAPLDAPVA